ncbi:radical SAM protein [Pseudomonas sp. LS1212]|uniref:coproporphyrinogen-III oxidase family protein n=1 Tax=Pseudomonas sp. LS1212 TaxID=2972478 RepID=UPI00215BB07B|nr:radical SAM protein [Pseudomonas sp. LS1212]UVJ45237.1 radical SAM protein [Pseudomonas sp. LS1212]
MKLINNGLVKFDYQFPLYNFFFPSQSLKVFQSSESQLSQILTTANEKANSRALYFHIPFCEAICSFCPFTRGLYKDKEDINRYTAVLLKEIEYKSRLIDYKKVPVKAVFFGGGTPSLLSPKNIYDIGESLHRHFDMSTVDEFSFEFNVSSVNKERVIALSDIGVTHARFGLQTIDPMWRKLFNLNDDIGEIERAAALLVPNFKNVLCDIMYGMNGSGESQTLADIDKAVELGLTNIDIYPINNVATSVKLHKKIKENFNEVMPAMRKLNMKLMIDEHMRQKGFVPYNGHGYVRTSSNSGELITKDYSFIYHEHVYGYEDCDLLGFGVGAISSVAENVITNTPLREKYINKMSEGECICQISHHDAILDTIKPVVLRLPYHGEINKRRAKIEKMPKELMDKVHSLLDAQLITETDDAYKLTRLGYLWYSNIMYYLIPKSEQNILKKLVFEKLNTSGRDITRDELIYSAS